MRGEDPGSLPSAASYRFEKPLLRVAAYTVPFILAILGAVLIITYVPGLALLGSP